MQFVIKDKIGSGQYGEVYRGVREGRQVAVKIYKKHSQQQGQLTIAQRYKNTQRQINFYRKYKHPNILNPIAFRKKGQQVQLILEYAPYTLLQYIRKFQLKIDVFLVYQDRIAQIIIKQLIQVLAFLNKKGLIHRDLKPQNILITNNNQVKLIDYGFITESKYQIKTPDVYPLQYRPPQVFAGDTYNQQADIWAFGCILCQFIQKKPIFNAKTSIDILYKMAKLCGPFTFKQNNLFLTDKKKVIKIQKQQNALRQKFYLKASQNAIDLIQKCLKMQPKERITPDEALNHPFFYSLIQQQKTKQKKRLHKIKRSINFLSTHEMQPSLQIKFKQRKQFNRYSLSKANTKSQPNFLVRSIKKKLKL